MTTVRRVSVVSADPGPPADWRRRPDFEVWRHIAAGLRRSTATADLSPHEARRLDDVGAVRAALLDGRTPSDLATMLRLAGSADALGWLDAMVAIGRQPRTHRGSDLASWKQWAAGIRRQPVARLSTTVRRSTASPAPRVAQPGERGYVPASWTARHTRRTVSARR